MISEAFKEKLDDLIPKGLDDIIRKNREHCQIRHATEVDLAPILGEVPQAHPKLVITNWHLVSIAIKDEYKVVLLGDIADGSGYTWITSAITRIDLKSKYLMTKSGSLYLMADKDDGSPSFEQLALLCAYLRKGGAEVGEFLGIPEFF